MIDQALAIDSDDPVLRSFAVCLPNHFKIVDLRNVDPGMGFSWAGYGLQTEVRRHGYERIFAYATPPESGWLSKLFGM